MNELEELARKLGVRRHDWMVVPCSWCGIGCKPVMPLGCLCIKCYAKSKKNRKPSPRDRAMNNLERVLPRTIFLARHGSHAYGTNIPGSDTDFKGVCIETKSYFYGFMQGFEQLERREPYDLVIMSIRKFCKLASDCNPNIIEILNVSDDDIVHMDTYGERLRSIRQLFLSKKARYTFAGYAHAQLKRIKTHRKWLMDEPPTKPNRGDFNLGETSKVSKSELGAFEALMRDGVAVEMPADVLTLFVRERQYQSAMQTYNQYETWKANRNEARADLERKWGVDTKHAMHLIRLMRMCREILRDGEVIVRRPDAGELLQIRAGEWTYETIVGHAEDLEAECAELYEKSPLPYGTDKKAIDEIVVEMTEEYLAAAG